MRNVGAVLAGLFCGFVTNGLLMGVSSALYPMPEGLDPTDPDALARFIQGLPIGAMMLAMAAHLGQALVGGLVAASISTTHSFRVAMGVGAISMLGGIGNLLSIPHPGWMWLEVPLHLVCAGWAGSLVAQRKGQRLGVLGR